MVSDGLRTCGLQAIAEQVQLPQDIHDHKHCLSRTPICWAVASPPQELSCARRLLGSAVNRRTSSAPTGPRSSQEFNCVGLWLLPRRS